jgi:methyl-accepting chemotaxis protein
VTIGKNLQNIFKISCLVYLSVNDSAKSTAEITIGFKKIGGNVDILNQIIKTTTTGITEIHSESQSLDNLAKALMQIVKGIQMSKHH